MQLYTRIVATDLLTPLAAYLRLRELGAGLLLESAEQDGRLGRHSFVLLTAPAALAIPMRGRAWLEKLRAARLCLPNRRGLPLGVGLAGYVGFEALAALEPTLAAPKTNSLGLPTVLIRHTDAAVVFDHHSQTAEIQVLDSSESAGRARVTALAATLEIPLPDPVEEPGRPVATFLRSRAQFEDLVRTCQRLIHDGDVYQVVPSHRVRVDQPPSPLTAYRRLRRDNPSPHSFLLEWPELALVGASPEMLVRVESGEVETLPIAGTTTRTGDAAMDDLRARALLDDPKERAEHQMLVDLARNDLGHIAPPGGVRVENPLVVHRTSRLLHLTTSVKARLLPGLDALDALAACFPAGTVSGAPKIRAAQRIAELEKDCRGPYGGALLRLGADGSLDSALILRTAVYARRCAWLQAGAGVVRRSDPTREYFETLAKMSAVAAALGIQMPEEGKS